MTECPGLGDCLCDAAQYRITAELKLGKISIFSYMYFNLEGLVDGRRLVFRDGLRQTSRKPSVCTYMYAQDHIPYEARHGESIMWLCVKGRLGSAYASAQSDQSLRC